MIQEIEKLRKLHKVSKVDLCKSAGISAQMYGKYLAGSSISSQTVEKMLKRLGYKLGIMVI